MAILDTQRNRKGIQALTPDFATSVAAGQGSTCRHSDGYIYCVFARNELAGHFARGLYLTRSQDGVTWSSAVKINMTANNWYDDPAIVEHDSTNLALVCNEATGPDATNYLIRTRVNKLTGAVVDPLDHITGNPSDRKWINLVKTAIDYRLFCLSSDSVTYPAVDVYISNTFTSGWSSSSIPTIFPANRQPMSLSVKAMPLSEHMVLSAAYRTSLVGRAGSESGSEGMGNLPAGIMLCDAGVAFSSNYGVSWSTLQNITNYAGTPTLDLIGIPSVVSVDSEEMSDGTITVAYQEAIAPQYISGYSPAFKLPTTTGLCEHVIYHAGKNALFITGSDATGGGLFVVNLTTQSVTRLYAGNTDPDGTEFLHGSNSVSALSLSADGNLLAIGTTGGGLTILNIIDANPLNWTSTINAKVRALRHTSVFAAGSDTWPGATSAYDNVFKLAWDGNDDLFWSWGMYGGNTIWGAKYTLSTDVFLLMHGSFVFNASKVDFLVEASRIVSTSTGNALSITNKSGVNTGSIPLSSNPISLVYDSINAKYLALSAEALMRVGTVEEAVYTATTTPACPGGGSYRQLIEVPGKGLIIGNAHTEFWYSFHDQKPYGHLVHSRHSAIGENQNNTVGVNWGKVMGDWLAKPTFNGVIFVNHANTGRIRYGQFPYDSGNKSLVTNDVDFYDMVNALKVPDISNLRFPRLTRDANDYLYCYLNRFNLSRNGQEFAPVIGLVEPDTRKLYLRAKIVATSTRNLYIRGKLSKRIEDANLLRIGVKIVFAQCLKLKARIVPHLGQATQLRACILNTKTIHIPGIFTIQKTDLQKRLHVSFYANTGNMRARYVDVRACISQATVYRATGHFLVAKPSTTTTYGAIAIYQQTLSMKASIQ